MDILAIKTVESFLFSCSPSYSFMLFVYLLLDEGAHNAAVNSISLVLYFFILHRAPLSEASIWKRCLYYLACAANELQILRMIPSHNNNNLCIRTLFVRFCRR